MNLFNKFHSWRRKKRWDKQYKNGRWAAFKDERETNRYGTIIEFLKKYAPNNPSIFDIGCGDGVLNERIGEMPFSYFLGLDFSKESIKQANSKNFQNAEFISADIIGYVPERKFDAIIFNEAFYYIHETERQNVINNLMDHLTENGIVIVSIYREGNGCWHYFKEDPRWKELNFVIVTTNEDLQYWKIGAYKKTSNS